MNLPDGCLVVDTNVPATANRATLTKTIPKEELDLVFSCVEAIEHAIRKAECYTVAIDDQDEFFDEYSGLLSLSGDPGIGDRFMRWVSKHRYEDAQIQRVQIVKKEDSYEQFPNHEGLKMFDPSDKKFVAVANVPNKKLPILQASDSKWWGWKDALKDVGIEVIFLCPEYIKEKYEKKIGGRFAGSLEKE